MNTSLNLKWASAGDAKRLQLVTPCSRGPALPFVSVHLDQLSCSNSITVFATPERLIPLVSFSEFLTRE